MSFFEELKRRNVVRVGIAYTIAAWVLLQVADLVLENIAAPPWVIQAMMLVVALGFVAAVIIAWAYEMTPEGIKKESEVDRTRSITSDTGKKLDRIIIGFLLVAVAVLLVERSISPQSGPDTSSGAKDVSAETSQAAPVPESRQQDTPGIDSNSIAVLPFANRSNLDDDLFFTDGIHDDLLTQLAKINDLKVISRTSVMEYRDTTKKIPEIAAELGVAKILEGGVHRAGKRIRINAQLIDVTTDEHLWAETFDREMTLDNIFDIQSEITRQIVTAVRGELTETEQQAIGKAPTDNLEAWEAYLHARAGTLRADYSAQKYIEAEPWARRAVELDPEFADAWALLSEIGNQAIWIGFDDTPERREDLEHALERAVSLAPQSAAVKAAQADYLYRIEVDYPGAEKLFKEALEIAPGDARIMFFLAITQRRLGLWEESINTFERSLELDPSNVFTGSQMINTLQMMNEWDRVERLADEWMLRYPESGDLVGEKVQAMMLGHGDLDGAREIFDMVPPSVSNVYFGMVLNLTRLERDYEQLLTSIQSPEVLQFSLQIFNTPDLLMGVAHHLNGQGEEARWYLKNFIKQKQEEELSGPIANAFRLSGIGQAYAYLGDFDSALAAMEEADTLLPIEKDHVFGPNLHRQQTLVMAMAGQRDEALERLAANIDAPEGFARWQLHLDPAWDFFRDDERFNELVRPLNLEEAKQ
jgi:TolB-like protein/cytochrome c-type biogenesis protein CcmH/NrfG